MPPKRDATTSVQPPLKVIKMDGDAQDFSCESENNKYTLDEEPSYSVFTNNEVRFHCTCLKKLLMGKNLTKVFVTSLRFTARISRL